MVSVSDRIARNLPTVIHRARRGGSATARDEAPYRWYDESCPCGVAAGECRIHPRARSTQRPPPGDWAKWLLMAGRGHGKTAAGAQWIRYLAENAIGHRLAMVAPTVADARDVMVEGESGVLSVCPPWNRPRYHSTTRRLTWPNGVIATTYSADEPERLRGPQHTHAWIDEPGAWRYGERAFDMLMFGLRLGTQPRVLATTTPRPTKLIKGLVADPRTIVTRGTTYDNRPHLAPAFFAEIIAKYEGTRLGEQELNAELLELTEGVWFPNFSRARHVSELAEYQTGLPVRLAIDAGVSRHTGAVAFQVIPQRQADSPLVHVFADYYALDLVSADNAVAIKAEVKARSYGDPEIVRLDPAASARTGIGPAAYNEYERVFGSRYIARWPAHRVVDGLDQIELLLGGTSGTPRLLIHPRCVHLIKAFQNYRRKESNTGEFLDDPVDPQHPFEDHMDALRGGVRDAMPEGRKAPPNVRTIHASGLR
jgi:phage terminase large subunit-like protein